MDRYHEWKEKQKLKQIFSSRPQKYIKGDLNVSERVDWVKKTEQMSDKEWKKYMTRVINLKPRHISYLQFYVNAYPEKFTPEYVEIVDQLKPGIYVGPEHVTSFWTPRVWKALVTFANDPLNLSLNAAVSVASSTLSYKKDSPSSFPAYVGNNLILSFLVWYVFCFLVFCIPLAFSIIVDLFLKIPNLIEHYISRRYEITNQVEKLYKMEGSARKFYDEFEKQYNLVMDAIISAREERTFYSY